MFTKFQLLWGILSDVVDNATKEEINVKPHKAAGLQGAVKILLTAECVCKYDFLYCTQGSNISRGHAACGLGVLLLAQIILFITFKN